MAHSKLTNAKLVQDNFGELLGRAVTAKLATVKLDMTKPTASGIYVLDDGKPYVLMTSDLPFVAYSGAGLALIPIGVANEQIKKGQIGEDLYDNFKEVLNVASRVLELPNEPHIKLGPSFKPGEKLPPEIMKATIRPLARMDLDVTVQGYGAGKVAFFAL